MILTPKISVITVVKNGMPYLQDALRSFDNQTIKNAEHIIVYSSSEDNTESFLNTYRNKKKIIKDDVSKNKFGAINKGISLAEGEIIGLLHADDFYPSNETLEKIYQFYESNNSDIIYGNIKFCQKNNTKKIIRFWKSEKFNYKKLPLGWMPPHTSMYVKNKIIKKNTYSQEYPISGDYKFILDLFTDKKLKKDYFNEVLCVMRSGGDSTKLTGLVQKFREDIKISKKFFKNYFLCIILKILRKINQFKI